MRLLYIFACLIASACPLMAQSTGAVIELDENGWTEFTLRSGGNIYYVSSSEGNNTNDGLSEATPFRTIGWGLTRMSGGDWLLLKRGDVFAESLNSVRIKSGVSAEHKTVVGAYGDSSDPRPVIDPGTNNGWRLTRGSVAPPERVEHIALVSLHFYKSMRDPNSPNYVAGTSAGHGVQLYTLGGDLLFEDTIFEFFGTGFSLNPDNGAPVVDWITGVTVRRCQIKNNYNTSAHAQGIYIVRVNNLLIEENLFDHNGHMPGIEGAEPTEFNHNMYIQGQAVPDIVIRRNIIARGSSHGVQLRPGGYCTENVFIQNNISGFVADNSIGDYTADTGIIGVIVLNDNVVIENAPWAFPADNRTPGWGLSLEATSKPIPAIVEMKNNIVANGDSEAQDSFKVHSRLAAAADTSGNITYNWGSSQDTTPPPGGWPDPDRTAATYNASLGGAATTEAYLAAVAEQGIGNWSPDYTWDAIWNYVHDGFFGDPIEEGVTVAPKTLLLNVGQTDQLVATVLPEDAPNKNVTWSSDATNVVTVDAMTGVVTAVAVGTATITATTEVGGFTDTCVVTVESPPVDESMPIGSAAGAPPVIDGDIAEWSSISGSPIELLASGMIDNAEDLSASVKMLWDTQYLYVNVNVTDDSVITNGSLNPWQVDSVEFALNLVAGSSYNLVGGTLNDDEGKYTWVYGDDGDVTRNNTNRRTGALMVSADFQLATTDVSGGYAFEARIPWTDVYAQFAATVGVIFEAEVFINDNDSGTAREAVGAWSGTNNINNNNSAFAKIRLAGDVHNEGVFAARIEASSENSLTGLYHSDWFGYFFEMDDWNGEWIAHQELGWLYTGEVSAADSMWVWSVNLSTWLYSGSPYYPWSFGVQNAQSPADWIADNGSHWLYSVFVENSGEGWIYSTAETTWFLQN